MPSIKRIHLIVHGIVQGVNFRYSAQQRALSLGLVGWVRNKKDGTVEAVAQGREDEIGKFIQWCNTGPKMAQVTKVEANEVAPSSKLSDFTIEF
ncbi:MAG: acylphosphatase [Candidatus Dadabacteria bacterium]|nr:acylphosphatase [Candidatus Dadabacteria bacterium]